VRLYGWVAKDWNLHGLITLQFMHGSFFHLFYNMVFLWAFGSSLETLIGKARYLIYYLAGGAVAALSQTLYTFSFTPDLLGIPLIGSSGAIFAIMGIYLVRCYYSKINVVIELGVPFLIVPKRFKVWAVAVIGFYLLLNLYYGLHFHGMFVPVAFWAHIGGLMFGVALGLGTGLVSPAVLDMRRQRSTLWIGRDLGLGTARADLQELLKANPCDAWALLELARIETRYRKDPGGEALYRRAVLASWKDGDRAGALQAYEELLVKYRVVLSGPLQISLCREIIKAGKFDLAARALEVLIEKEKEIHYQVRAQVLEQAYVLLGRLLADKLDCRDFAARILKDFIRRFPNAKSRDMALQKLRLLTDGKAASASFG